MANVNGQTYTLGFNAELNISQMRGAISNIQGELNKLKFPDTISKGMQGTLNNLEKALRNYEIALSKDLSKPTNSNAFLKAGEKLNSLWQDLTIQAREFKNINLDELIPKDTINRINNINKALETYHTKLKAIETDIGKKKKQLITWQSKKDVAQEIKNIDEQALQDSQKQYESVLRQIYSKVGTKVSSKQQLIDKDSIKQALSDLDELEKKYDDIINGKRKDGKPYAQSTIDNAVKQKTKIQDLRNSYQQLNTEVANSQKAYDQSSKSVAAANKRIQEIEGEIRKLQKIGSSQDSSAIKELFNSLSAEGIDISKYTQDLDGAKKAIEDYKQAALDTAQNGVTNLNHALEDNSEAFNKNGQNIKDEQKNLEAYDAQARDITALKQRIQYFFGLNNAVNLVRRAIRGAFETIKELDKAMTETAVVTDFSVGDMWKQLPEYTKRANELGVSTLAAYQAATLYYQQGLKTEEVNALSVETLKMARIAGLEAAEATDRMTNALRGFNMALTEANAQRVDDVYSELAANTASNVDEISTAMTKVASLAHNANMEFETTSAFLAQIIETTRESAETAGTALKTVVARFSEVKKLVDEGTLRGQDEEGQIIDVNRVGQALRTAGIDLNKYFLGEVGLDDIFMELASKWESLTSLQQRYIATQAAGSRQQSRFIALMSDYARTQELVGKAYNANGAAAKQFAKTQESLESKLARLKNAWNEFLMGLTNNQMVKGFVDLLTDLLNAINKVTSAFGEGAGSIAKWGVVLGGLAGGKALFSNSGLLVKGVASLTKNTPLGTLLEKSGWGQQQEKGPGLFQKLQMVSASLQYQQARSNPKNVEQIAAARQKYFDTKKATGIGNISDGITNIGKLGKKFAKSSIGGKLIGKLGLGKFAAAGGTKAAVAGVAALGTAFVGVTACAAAAAATIKTLYDLSPAGQVKIAEKYAKVLSTIATESKKTADNYKENIKKIKDYNDAVDKATTGKDKTTAIKNRNEYITSLLEQDNTYAKYLTQTFKNGQLVLELDSSKLEEALAKAEEATNKANTYSQFANAALAGRKINLNQSKLFGVDLENRQIVTAGAMSNNERKTDNVLNYRDLTDAEISRYTQYQQLIDENKDAMKQFAKNAFSGLIDTDKVSDETADLMSEALATGFEDAQLPIGSGWTRSRNHWRNEYLKYYGTEAADSMKTADIYRAVKQAEQGESKRQNVDKLTALLNNAQFGDAYKKILELYANQTDFGKLNLTLSDVEGLELLDKDLSVLADAIGVSEDQLKTIIKQNAQAAKEQQQKTNLNTSREIVNIGTNLNKGDQWIAEKVADLLALQSYEEQAAINELLTSTNNDQISATILDNLEDTDLREWIAQLDFSDPIHQILQLQNAIESGATPAIRSLASELIKTNNVAPSQLLQSFLAGSDYETLTESLDNFIKENGEITSTNILELAESNEKLNDLLKTGAVSAKALAVALTGIQTNEIQMWNLNDAIIAALNSMDDLDSIVKRTIDDLNSFDPGYDENDVTGFINKVIENATGNIEKGAWGNNQMQNYFEYIFGNYSGAPGDEYREWIETNLSWLEANKDNMKSAWIDVANTMTEGGAGVFDEGVRVWQENGEILIDAAGHTTDELIAILSKGTNLTDQQLRMMIADYKNYSDDFALLLKGADTKKAVEEWAKSVADKGYYLDTELKTLAALLKVDVKDINKILDDIYGSGTTEEKTIKWDEEKNTRENVENVLKQTGRDNYYIGSDQKIVDFNKLKESMDDADLAGYFESTINQMTKDGVQFQADFGNGLVDITQQTGESISEAFDRMKKEAADTKLFEDLGNTIVEALTTHNIQIGVDEENVAEQLKTLFGIIDPAIEGHNNDITVTVTGTSEINTLASAYSDLAKAAEKAADAISKVPGASASGTSTPNNSIPETPKTASAKGGIVKSYGSGANHIEPGTALTGEEGPEIVWNKEKGYAYITGENHPEFQDLQPGDRIFNASETKRILSMAKGGKIYNSYSDPSHGYGGVPATKKKGKGGGSGSGSGSDKDDEWKNDLDWLYNVMENIAELERQQNIYQEEYEDLLKDQTKTGQDLYKMLIKQLGNLYAQLDHQTYTLERREQEMREFMDTTNDQDEYLWYNWEDRTIEIDWDAIDKITDQEKYDHIKDLISEAEEIQDKMDDAEDAIIDVENQIQELENIWRDTFTEFEERVLDAIVKMYQTVIDNYSELNDTLNETNTNILDAINKEISLQRQIRDNTKTEQEIADNEAELAYLQRDTTGGNALDILQRGKDLDEQREDYQDTLIDQAIQKLQEDNDAAAQQREKQIEIMQAQLDYQSENGEFNAYIRELMESAIDPDGHLATDSELYKLLAEQENIDAMTKVQRDVWEEELTGTFKEVAAFLLKEQGEAEGTYFTAVTAAFNGISDTFDKAFHGSYSQGGVHGGSKNGKSSSGSNGNNSRTKDNDNANVEVTATYLIGMGSGQTRRNGELRAEAQAPSAPKTSKSSSKTRQYGDQTTPSSVKNELNKMLNKIKKDGYSTGGLNTQTGLAMLHGTASEPEYVLNARQTDAFLKLADVLPAAMNTSGQNVSNTLGATTNNVVINVDKIDSDYSVDQMVNRVKEKLFESGSYRNNNVLSLMR